MNVSSKEEVLWNLSMYVSPPTSHTHESAIEIVDKLVNFFFLMYKNNSR